MDGGFGDSEEGIEKEQGRETRFTENVPGTLNKESLCALLRQSISFFISFYFCLWYNSSILTQVIFDI